MTPIIKLHYCDNYENVGAWDTGPEYNFVWTTPRGVAQGTGYARGWAPCLYRRNGSA